MATVKQVLAIGGLDPSGHAGLLADVRVFDRLNVAYRVAVTALTLQSKDKCTGFQAVSPSMLHKNLHLSRSELSTVKLGMLGHPRLAKVLLDWLNKNPRLIFLWDPVWRASTGPFLIKPSGWNTALRNLLERTDIFTPNLPEAEWVLGRKIRDLKNIERALTDLHALGKRKQRVIVLKGGHSQDRKSHFSIDWLYDGKKVRRIEARRRPSTRRGTGCSFGAAMLVGITRGHSPFKAARFAKKYVLTHLLDAPTP